MVAKKRLENRVATTIFIMLIVLLIVFFAILLVREERKGSETVYENYGAGVLDTIPESELQQEMLVEREWLNTDDVLEGDSASNDYLSGATSDAEAEMELFQMGTVSETKSLLIALAEEYNEQIPYGYQGRSWSYGYFKQEAGYENILYDSCANGLGVDGLGYVIWLYRNALGHTPVELEGEFSISNLKHEVRRSDAQIGDLCVTSDKNQDVRYGVVCGFSKEGHIIVTMCDNVPNMRFKYGCNHLAYIQSDYDMYLGNYASVDFLYFYRLEEMVDAV